MTGIDICMYFVFPSGLQSSGASPDDPCLSLFNHIIITRLTFDNHHAVQSNLIKRFLVKK